MSKLVQFDGKHIPKMKIISIYKETHKVFPYIKITNPYRWKKEFPFVRQWLMSSCWRWVTRDRICIELENGKIIHEWYYDANYVSSVMCSMAMGNLLRGYEYEKV